MDLAVADGGSVIDPKVVEGLVADKTRGESPLDELTPRERDVLREPPRPAACRSTAPNDAAAKRGEAFLTSVNSRLRSAWNVKKAEPSTLVAECTCSTTASGSYSTDQPRSRSRQLRSVSS